MYEDLITEIPDFPIEGVNFKDISPLLSDQEAFRSALVDMGRRVRLPDYWVGIDSRGYLFASGLATYFGGGVICARKKGKTPGDIVSVSYDLEYGSATLEMQKVGMGGGEVVIVDDVLATGGTLKATNELAEKAGYAVVGNLVLIDLKYVPRVDNFDLDVRSVVSYV
jgi:adenine phosphoribosyltransferase|tara:strand:- start:141 stop:641 length:501 start_codon:yes stop_codon:yes gene_type:complete